jgi:putative hemolysin
MPFAYDLAVLFGLTLLNAVFAGSEIAVISLRASRLRELVDEERAGAEAVTTLRANPEQFLATVQVGITVVGAAAGAFGGSVMAAPLAGTLRELGAGDWADAVAFGAVVSLISFLSIVFGELVPKSLALRANERYALLVARPLLSLSRAAWPLVRFLTWTSNLVLRPLHDRTTFIETRMSPEELQQVVEEATTAGTLPPQAGEIASRAIDLGDLRANAVMLPRSTITWLPADAGPEETRRILQAHAHHRYPVRGATEQDVPGYVLARDVYEQLLAGEFDLQKALRKLPFFPERMSAVDVLRHLQVSRSKIGVVVDDYGAVAGLVSVEDIAEELLGEVVTEYDRPSSDIRIESEDSFLVNGTTPVHELNRELDLDLEAGPDFSTIAGLVIAKAGEIPKAGRRLAVDEDGEVEAEVLEATVRGIKLLRLRRVKLAPEAGADNR